MNEGKPTSSEGNFEVTFPKSLSYVIVGLVLLSGIYSLGRQMVEVRQIPTDASYVSAKNQLLDLNYKPGTDALAIFPSWSLRPLQSLGDLDPIGSDALPALPPLPFERLFVLEEPDGEEPMSRILKTYGPAEKTWHFGNVKLHLWTLSTPSEPGTFMARLDAAAVTIKSRNETVECVWREEAHRCDGEPSWQHVKRQWMRTSRNSNRMIWAHPPANKATLRISFEDETPTSHLILMAGHTRQAIRQKAAPVNVRIFFDGELLGSLKLGRQFPMALRSLELPKDAAANGTLTFEIESKNANKNNFGFDAYWANRPLEASL